jgi:hypothetical protein
MNLLNWWFLKQVMEPASGINSQAQYLSNLCGLIVRGRKEKSENVYDFWVGRHHIKTCWTYPKAKLFAEGIVVGKKLMGASYEFV